MNAEVLDAIDYKILALLYRDARITFSEIGQEVGLSRVAVKNRITAMEQCGIILGYKAVIDTTKVPGGLFVIEEAEVAPEDNEMEALQMSERCQAAFDEIRTLGQVVEGISSYEDLKKIRNCGAKSIDEIMGSLFCYQYEQYEIPEKINYIKKIMELN